MSGDVPWGRRLIICCDGTWQSSVDFKDNVPSNVTKLARVIARYGTDSNNKKWHQLVYYDSGVGTGNLSGSEAKRQGGTGAGLAENVIEAYNFIVLNYQEGDEIFCFGFSRGAYTARAVAGLVTDIGVIKPVDMQLFPMIYRAYMSNAQGKVFRESHAWLNFVQGKLSTLGQEIITRLGIDHLADSLGLQELAQKWSPEEKAQYWEIRPHEHLVASEKSRKVKVVGVWDTVGSLGIPDFRYIDNSEYRTKYGFHNVKLNENIEHAFHALALDERRKAFRPTLWYICHDLAAKLKAENKPNPELKQVWFPGVHINSGGGSDDAIGEMKGDLENLSNVSFTWMLQCIAPYITIDQAMFELWLDQFLGFGQQLRHACTYHHKTRLDNLKDNLPYIPFLNPSQDTLAPAAKDAPHQHPEFDFGWGIGPIQDSYTGIYLAAGPAPRLPGACQVEVYNEKKKEYVLDDLRKYGETNEYIHPVCQHRKVVRQGEKSEKSALAAYTRKFEASNQKSGEGRYWWLREGDTRKLPEWIILDHEHETKGVVNFERRWYESCEVSQRTAAALKKKGYEKDFLESLDKLNDFGLGDKTGYLYP